MSQILQISWVDIYRRFTDRTALLLNIVAPLMLSLIIGMALGGGSSDITIQEATVGIVNLDDGSLSYIYPCLMVEDPSDDLQTACQSHQLVTAQTDNNDTQDAIIDFMDAKVLTDTADAIDQVENGDLDVVIIIPAGFTAGIMAGQQVELQVHYNAGGGIPADVSRSIISSVTNQISTGAIASQVVPAYAAQNLGETDSATLGELAAQIQGAIAERNLDEMIEVQRVSVTGDTQEFNALQYFAPSMAIFFMTFAMADGARSILEDRRDGTLQRILTTPTRRWQYLAGKLLGTYASGIFQMVFLIVAMIIVGNGLMRTEVAIWGTNIIGISLMVVSVVAAATGVGMIIAALARTLEQVQTMTSLVLVSLGAIGGTFVDVSEVPVVNQLSKLTLNYWGLDGFFALATEKASVGDILPNVAVLLAIGGVCFTIAISRFNKRLDY